MGNEDGPRKGASETTAEKTARLKAARLAEQEAKKVRVDRAVRKAAARKKVLG